MHRILVLNAKGGCGKTTLATNLAGYYASTRRATMLLDYDPQGSSMKWLGLRAQEHPMIQGIAAYNRRHGVTRAYQMRLPDTIETVILDAPAGISGLQLADFVQKVDTILVPVLPSPIDIHAVAHFIQDLLIVGKVRSARTRIGIVANRVRENTLVYRDLQRFLDTLRLPLVAVLRDSQNYIRAVQQGIGIHELAGNRVNGDIECWNPLIGWLNEGIGTGTQLHPLPENIPPLATLQF